jgi:hypothetical protein
MLSFLSKQAKLNFVQSETQVAASSFFIIKSGGPFPMVHGEREVSPTLVHSAIEKPPEKTPPLNINITD